MGELDIGPRPGTIPPKEKKVGVMAQEIAVGPKILNTCTCSMLKKLLMVLGEVDLVLGPALVPPTIQVIIVDHMVFIVEVIT